MCREVEYLQQHRGRGTCTCIVRKYCCIMLFATKIRETRSDISKSSQASSSRYEKGFSNSYRQRTKQCEKMQYWYMYLYKNITKYGCIMQYLQTLLPHTYNAIPLLERTHLESPALATVSEFSLSRHRTAVVPL